MNNNNVADIGDIDELEDMGAGDQSMPPEFSGDPD